MSDSRWPPAFDPDPYLLSQQRKDTDRPYRHEQQREKYPYRDTYPTWDDTKRIPFDPDFGPPVRERFETCRTPYDPHCSDHRTPDPDKEKFPVDPTFGKYALPVEDDGGSRTSHETIHDLKLPDKMREDGTQKQPPPVPPSAPPPINKTAAILVPQRSLIIATTSTVAPVPATTTAAIPTSPTTVNLSAIPPTPPAVQQPPTIPVLYPPPDRQAPVVQQPQPPPHPLVATLNLPSGSDLEQLGQIGIFQPSASNALHVPQTLFLWIFIFAVLLIPRRTL